MTMQVADVVTSVGEQSTVPVSEDFELEEQHADNASSEDAT